MCVLLFFVLIMLFFLCPYRSPVLIVEVIFSVPVLTDVVNQLQIDMAQLKESMDLYVSMTPAKTVETNVEQENCMILSGFTEDQVCLWLCIVFVSAFVSTRTCIMHLSARTVYTIWPQIVAQAFRSFM